jgi:hypothetical protein
MRFPPISHVAIAAIANVSIRNIVLRCLVSVAILAGIGDRCKAVTATLQSSIYNYIQGSFTWVEAKADAEARGGRLAVLNTQDKIDSAHSYLRSLGLSTNPSIWIGLTDAEQDDQWRWLTGEPLNNNSWYPGEPNNSNNNEDCCLIWYSLMQAGQPCWNDAPNSSRISYLLEIQQPNIWMPEPCPTSVVMVLPIESTIALGASVTLESRLTWSDNWILIAPSYQWKKDGIDILNANSETFTLINAQPADAGSYTVVVNGVMSNAATITVAPPVTIHFNNGFIHLGGS